MGKPPISVDWSELKPGDVIVGPDKTLKFATRYLVERAGLAEPDQGKIYVTNIGNAQHLIKANNFGYWHAYELVQGTGLYWDAFVERFNIEDEAIFNEIGTNTENGGLR